MSPPIKNGTVGDWRLSDADFLASFHLPGASDKHEKLMDLHPLPRDRRIRLDEEKHEYPLVGNSWVHITYAGHMRHMTYAVCDICGGTYAGHMRHIQKWGKSFRPRITICPSCALQNRTISMSVTKETV